MVNLSPYLGSDWILEEAFVLKNRSRGGVGTVIPFGLHPASGRCEPLPHRLLSLPAASKAKTAQAASTEAEAAADPNNTSNQEDDDDDYFERA